MQKSTVGGILSIVAGALGSLGGLLLITAALFAHSIFTSSDVVYNSGTFTDQQFATIFGVIYGIMGAFTLVLGILGIVGGTFAIQRKHWGWALAGAIGGCLTFLPLGVGAVVLVAMGRSEFKQNIPTVTPQPVVNNPI